MKYAFPPNELTSLPIRGDGRLFPIRRVYCIGRNYAEHAIEMGGDPDREPPFFFQKNPENVIQSGMDFPYPPKSNDVHFEVELVVALKEGGYNIAENDSLNCVWGYGVGIDMTRRDLQSQAKKNSRPWEVAKAFESSAPCSELVSVEQIGHPNQGKIYLDVNGDRKQEGDLSQLIWSVSEIISKLSELFELGPGDLIFTGTPAGVGPLKVGDLINAHVEGVAELEVRVVQQDSRET